MKAETNPPAAEFVRPYRYGPMVRECNRRGIGRTMAFKLQKLGLIETFLIGSKRMVMIASLEALPERLRQPAANEE